MNRFGNLLRWSLLTEKKQYVKYATGLFIVYFLLMGSGTGLFTGYNYPVNPGYVQNAALSCIVAWVVAGGVLTSELFNIVRTKQQRIAFLMLPATNKEKYWSRVAVVMAQGFVLSTICLVAADLVQMLVSLVFSGNAYSIWAHLPHDYSEPTTILENIAIISVCTWSMSAYILGGTVFRRMPFVMTTLVWNVLWILFGITIVSFVFKFAEWLEFFDKYEIEFWWGTENTLMCGLAVVATAFTVFNMWLSYRLFCRLDINAKKLLNI